MASLWRNNARLFGRTAEQNTGPRYRCPGNYVASVRTRAFDYIILLTATGPEAARREVCRLLLVSGSIVRIEADMTISPSKLKFQHFDATEAEVAHDWDDPSVGPWLVNALLTVCQWFDQTDNLNSGKRAVFPEQLNIVGIAPGQELVIHPSDYFSVWQGA